MSLDTRWLVLVKDTTGRNPDKWVTLAELDSYINTEENAKIGDWKAFDVGEGHILENLTEAVEYLLEDAETRLDEVTPTSGAPITVRTKATAISGEGNNDEITWTAEEEGADGNGISIDITLSAEATYIDITVTPMSIVVVVKTGGGITATDVLNAVNAHAQAKVLVQGALTGGGGAITADSVVTSGGTDITAAPSGAIRYEATKIWISVEESTATESNWMSADLTDPNGA